MAIVTQQSPFLPFEGSTDLSLQGIQRLIVVKNNNNNVIARAVQKQKHRIDCWVARRVSWGF